MTLSHYQSVNFFFCLHDPSWRHACHAASGTGTARPRSWRIPGRWPWRWCFLPWVWLAKKKRPKLRRFDENIGKHLLGPLIYQHMTYDCIWIVKIFWLRITIVTQLHSKHLPTIWLILCSKTLNLWREIGSISSQPLQSPGVQWVPGAAGRSSCGSFWAQAVILKSLCSIRFFSWYYSVNLGIFHLENYWDEVDSFNSLCIFLYFALDGFTSPLSKFVARFLQADELSPSLYLRRLKPEAIKQTPKKVKALPKYHYWTIRWLQDGHGVFKHPSLLDDRLELVWITSLRAHWNMWFISDPLQQAMWFHNQFIEFLFGRPPPSTSGKWMIIGIPYKNERSSLLLQRRARQDIYLKPSSCWSLYFHLSDQKLGHLRCIMMYHWKHLIHHGFKQIQLLPSLNQAWTGSTGGPDQMKGWKAFPFLSANSSSKFSASGSEEIQEKNKKRSGRGREEKGKTTMWRPGTGA